MDSTRIRLIDLLEKNKEAYISGQELSKQLNISRTAVWKHMKELEKDGYKIEAFPKKGYQITEFPSKLSSNTLAWGLHTKWLGKKLIHKEQINSTQTIANELAAEGADHGTVIIADEQIKGRGRMTRTWHSAKDEGIWMSMILRPNILPHQAPQITLLAATVIADVIQLDLDISVRIKWPNDILIHDKKAAGILTEMQAEQDQIRYIVLGIGLNVNHSEDSFPSEIKEKATSLKMESNKDWDRKEIIQKLIERFELSYDEYIQSGFANTRKKWESYGYKIGEVVEITTSKQTFDAMIKGVQPDGALIIQHEDGSSETLYSAEIKW